MVVTDEMNVPDEMDVTIETVVTDARIVIVVIPYSSNAT